VSNNLKKLALNQETVRNLNQDEFRNVVGGFGNTHTCSCNYTYCCPTFTCVVPGKDD
jgi:natural product precursor